MCTRCTSVVTTPSVESAAELVSASHHNRFLALGPWKMAHLSTTGLEAALLLPDHVQSRPARHGSPGSDDAARDRLTPPNRESGSVERREARQRSARICLRGQLDSGTWCVAKVFALTQAGSC